MNCMSFESVHNYHEAAVFQWIGDEAYRYPTLAGRADLLADVACVALNRMPPRYVLNDLDTAFYMDAATLAQQLAAVREAVEFAFKFVQARTNRESR